MPSSKSKKTPKSKTNNNNSDTNSSNNNHNKEEDDDEQSLLKSINEASNKYPTLIGGSALICKILENGIHSKGCKIWLSESSLIASDIIPGSIVSVSLASSWRDVSDHPLSSLVDECGRHYGFSEKMAKETGNYFVLATVFPSCKVSKNGVRLSSTLSSAMGYPGSGRTIFVYPVNHGNSPIHKSPVNSISIYSCKDLHLSLVSTKSSISTRTNKTSHTDFPIDHNGHIGNGNISSPKTPSISRSKFSSPCSSQPTSPRQRETPSNSFDSSFDSSNLREVLEDESGKKLLQTCTMSLVYSRHLLCGNLMVIPILSELCVFKVVSAEKVSEDGDNEVLERSNAFLVDHGLSKEYSVLRDIIISSSVKNTLSSMGLRPTKGVLLHGPPGTGKTSLARLCANDAGVNHFTVNGPEIVSQFYGESEQAPHAVFNSAIGAAPAVVFIDELDAIAPSRKEGGEELSGRIVATLLNLMDGISRTEGLLVIAATNRPDSIEPALRRPGRLDREIEIGVPSPSQRYDILLALLKEHQLLNSEIHHLALTTHGFVGADLASLCNEAAFVCLRRCINKSSDNKKQAYVSSDDMNAMHSENNLEGSSSSNSELHLGSVECGQMGECLSVSFQDFEKARIKVRPSAMREVILEVPKVSWKDIGGQKGVKMQLMEAVEWPQKHQDAFRRIGTRPPSGILLFGPPGCSKTLLARAVVSEAKLNFLAVKGPELFSKWVGESEKAIKSLFAKARANAPSIIFFDELDGLANIRGKENDGVSVGDRVISQILVELDDKIDSALLRPGRFDRLVYVGPPNEEDRKEIFSVHLRNLSCSSDVCIEELGRLSEGCTGADISLICREAALAAFQENLDASELLQKMIYSLKRPQQYRPLFLDDDVDINTLTLEQYLAWVEDDIRPGVVKPKIGNDVEFEINSKFMRELRRKLFKGTDDEDAHEHVRRVLEIAGLFHYPNVTHDAVMLIVFPITLKGLALRWINRLLAGRFRSGLDISTRRMLDSREFIPLMTPTQALKSIQIMADHSHDWYDETTTRERINNRSDNIDAIQASSKEAHLTKECPLKKDKEVEQSNEKDKTRTTKGKENVKESFTRDLLVVQTYVPPTLFLGHLKGRMGSSYRTREIVCMIGNPEEIHKIKAQEDEGDMVVGPVHDKEKIITKEEHDYDIPLHDGVMQPLTPQTIHITPPDDNYVASTTNPILNKQLNEFRDEFSEITRVAKKAKWFYKKVEFEVSSTRFHVV
uniref:Calmodulin-interacting protein 111 isoform X1 n=1 Tax=Tanacetum cinerariifolium TaxID=118510 RepID=A0A6L2N9F9_TANCI|nr:calmodulin-interacting protein 111 isoform X1 [Tanacetum cinerariifolium]